MMSSRINPALANTLRLGYWRLGIGNSCANWRRLCFGLLAIGLLAAARLSGADGGPLLGYLPIVGPGALRFQGPLPQMAVLPPLPFDNRDLLGTNITNPITLQAADSALQPEPFWHVPLLPPDSANSPETNTVQLTSASPVPEILTLDTNSAVVTPQMLVSFFRAPSPGTNAGGVSLIMPLTSLPLNPVSPPPSSKATLTNQ